MAAEPKTIPDPTVTEPMRRRLRDMPPAPAPMDKARILARLRAHVAELQSEGAANGDT